jgi:ParB/RepB/Spo0J family partition protein
VSTTFEYVPIDRIVEVEGFNPRTLIEQEALKELVHSIKTHGVLTPITVRPGADGVYLLVEGHRRFKAAQAAGLGQMPCQIQNGDSADPATVAIVTNVVRSNLHPVDEGRALARIRDEQKLKTIAALAKRVGMSPDRVKRSVRYAELPDTVNAAFLDGRLPLYATDAVVEVAKLGGAFCAAVIGHALAIDAAGDVPTWESTEIEQLCNDPAWYVHEALAHLERSEEWTVLPVDQPSDALARVPALDELRMELNGLYAWSWHVDPLISLSEDELDAANAYGCLVTLSHGDDDRRNAARYITDHTWYIDHIEPKLRTAIELGKEKAANLAKMNDAAIGRTVEDPSVPPKSPEVLKAEQQEQRRVEREQKATADKLNHDFGANLAAKLGKRKPTADDLRLVAELLFFPAGTDNLHRMGWLRVSDELLVEEQTKSGKKKLVEPPQNEARMQLMKWVTRPTAPDEIFGRLMQVLVAAAFADHDAVAQSRRYPNLDAGADHLFKVGRTAIPEGMLEDARKRAEYRASAKKSARAWEAKLDAASTRLSREARRAREEEAETPAAAAEAPPITEDEAPTATEDAAADIAEDLNA